MTPQDEMKMLVEKWKGKNPPFMSKDYIDMRFDRMRYIRLRKQANVKKAEGKTLYEEAVDLFASKEV